MHYRTGGKKKFENNLLLAEVRENCFKGDKSHQVVIKAMNSKKIFLMYLIQIY